MMKTVSIFVSQSCPPSLASHSVLLTQVAFCIPANICSAGHACTAEECHLLSSPRYPGHSSVLTFHPQVFSPGQGEAEWPHSYSFLQQCSLPEADTSAEGHLKPKGIFVVPCGEDGILAGPL